MNKKVEPNLPTHKCPYYNDNCPTCGATNPTDGNSEELRGTVRKKLEFIALYKGDADWQNNVDYALEGVMQLITSRDQQIALAARIGLHREIAQNRHRVGYQNELYKNDLEALATLKAQEKS